MPGRFLQVPGGVESYEKYYPGTLSPNEKEETTLWKLDWAFQKRGLIAISVFGYGFDLSDTRWPSCSGGIDDPANPVWLVQGNNGHSDMNAGAFEPWNYGFGGSQSMKFIMGQCKDSLGTPLGGAIVQGFRNSDDYYVGQIACDDQGLFMLPCPNTPTDQHYLVAYYVSGNLAGTTVNTLVPTWADGTV